MCFERKERQSSLSQCFFHIGVGSEDSFANPVFLAVHDGIEQLQTVIAHADGIDIGKGKAEPSFDGVLGFDNAAEFSTDVLPRQNDFGE